MSIESASLEDVRGVATQDSVSFLRAGLTRRVGVKFVQYL